MDTNSVPTQRPVSRELIAREQAVCARNYAPLPIVLEHAQGVWLRDVEGRRYLDFMSAYSAVSHGHRHPRIVAAARAQMERMCVTSRAFHCDTLGAFLRELCRISGFERALPMNTGAEAVETAIKAARRWAYRTRRIARDRAVILVAENNFHGRTSTIVGFSSEPATRDDFGPFSAGFRHFRFGDLASLDRVYADDVCAVLVEPIQGEAGVVVPPDGWLRALRDWCDHRRILLILDEVQSGLGRTGRTFAFEHEGIRPDALVLGKALGGGILPVSAFLADRDVMDVFEPGSHGSTFGGNALAAAVGLEALRVLHDEQLAARSAVLGRHLLARLQQLAYGRDIAVRGRGLWVGVDLRGSGVDAAAFVGRLAGLGVLTKETHESVVRIAPPLIVTKEELDWGIDQFAAALDEFAPHAHRRPAKGVVARPIVRQEDMQREYAPRTTQAPHLLMCPPDHFEVSYRINPWMQPDAWSLDAARLLHDAHESWLGLCDHYRRLGARIETMPSQPGLPDLVFTANSAVVLDGKVVLARFRNSERRGEEAHGRRFFETLRRRGIVESLHEVPEDVLFEGAGDALWDPARRVVWMGHGQRSSLQARDTVRRVFGVDTVSLELASARYYHLDTCLCVLSGGEVLWYPPAFSSESQALLRAVVGDQLIEAGDDDATRFGVNSVCLGRDVVMCHGSAPLRRQLEERGYRVTIAPLDAFNRSGGAVYCLTLRLDNRSRDDDRGTRTLAA